MSGYSIDIEEATLTNDDFRRVLFTAPHLQLVLMTLQPGEEVGMETHGENDQFFRVESGIGEAILDGEVHQLSDGAIVIVPSGAEHNVLNTSDSEPLRMYTLYAPPHHRDGTLHRTKEEADEYERHEHGH